MSDLLRTVDAAEPDLSHVGRGVPSGESWQTLHIDSAALDAGMHVLYAEDVNDPTLHRVETQAEWDALPEHGLQAIICMGGVWWGCDRYVLGGSENKYGLYLVDEDGEPLVEEWNQLRAWAWDEVMNRG